MFVEGRTETTNLENLCALLVSIWRESAAYSTNG
jgi:hypothetical protein